MITLPCNPKDTERATILIRNISFFIACAKIVALTEIKLVSGPTQTRTDSVTLIYKFCILEQIWHNLIAYNWETDFGITILGQKNGGTSDLTNKCHGD